MIKEDPDVVAAFKIKYLNAMEDGTLEDRKNLDKYRQWAAKHGVTYGGDDMPKYTSKRLQGYIDTAQKDVAETRAATSGPEVSVWKQRGDKAVDVAGKLSAGLSPAAILLMYPGNKEVRRILFGYNERGHIGMYTPTGITPKGERGVPQSGGRPGILSTATSGVGLGINRAVSPAVGALTGLSLGGIPGAVMGLVGGATGGYTGDPLEYLLNAEDRGMLNTAKRASEYRHPYEQFGGSALVDLATMGSNPLRTISNVRNAAKVGSTFARGMRAIAPATEAGAEAVAPTLASKVGRGAAEVAKLHPDAVPGAASAIMGLLPPASYVTGQIGAGQPIDPKMLGANALLGMSTQGRGLLGMGVTPMRQFLGKFFPGGGPGPHDIYGGGGPTPTPPPPPMPQSKGPLPPPGSDLAYAPQTKGPGSGSPQVVPALGQYVAPEDAILPPVGPRINPPVSEPDVRVAPSIEDLLGLRQTGQPNQPYQLQPEQSPSPYRFLVPEELQPVYGPQPAVPPPGPQPLYDQPQPSPPTILPPRGRPIKPKPTPTEPPAPKRGTEVETASGKNGIYKAKGVQNGKPTIWVQHPGDAQTTAYPEADVDVVGGKFTQQREREKVIRDQAGVGDYNPDDPTTFGPKTPKAARDVVKLLGGIKEGDLNPTQKQHLSDARKILAQEKILNAAEQKMRKEGGGPEPPGGKGSGETPPPSPGGSPRGPAPVVPGQPGQGTAPPVPATGPVQAGNAVPPTEITPTPPEKPKAEATTPSPINGNAPAAAPKRGDTYQENNKKGAYGSWRVTAVRQGYVHMENSAGAYKSKVKLDDFHNNYTQTDGMGRSIPINGNPALSSTAGQPPVPTPPTQPTATSSKPPTIPAGVKPENVDAATADVKAAVQKWATDPMDSKARTDLTKALIGHGVPLDDAAKFSSKLQGWVRGTKASGEGINVSLFGAESIPKLIGRAVAARRLRTAYEQTPTTDPRTVDLNTPKWDAADWVNLPISIVSPTGNIHQEGMLGRNLGPKGEQASKILADTSQTIDNEKLTAKRALDEIQAWLEAGRKKLGATVGKDIAGAVGKALTGVESAKDRFNRSFREYIEMTPAERATQDATGKVPPQVQKAVQLYDDFTGNMKRQLYDYQVNVLKRQGMPPIDQWGITDQGYFHHAMFKNFHATMSNGAEVEAGTYGELLHEIEQHIKVHGTTLDKVSGYENRVNDPSVRIDQAKFWAMVEDVSKAGGLDSKGRRILSRDDVMKDVLPGAIGTKANKSEFIGAILKRAGKEGYEDKAWRYIMNRYADSAIEGINVTKMRKQLQPLAEEIGKTNKLAQTHLENKMNLIAGKPTDNELKIANAIHNWEIHTKTPGYSPNPLRSFRNLANQIQATTFYATLGTKPEFAVVNELQRYVTLMSRIGPVAMAKAEAAAVTKDNVRMLRELGILDGEIKIVNRGGTLQAVLVGKNKARLLNPVNAIRNASERNRAVGFMHGYNSIMDAMNAGKLKPDGTKFTREDALQEGNNFSTMTEFKNNNFYSPDILKTPTGGLQWQYQGYTINNLKQWKDAVVRTYSPSLRHKGGITAKEARLQLGRKVVAQIGVGGVKSLMPAALMGAGTYFWLKDQGVDERVARAVTFGIPSIGAIDVSGQTAMAPDMIGNAAPGTTLLGPTVSSALRVGQEAKRDIEGGTFPERTMRTLPPTRQLQAAYSILTGQPLYYSIRGMKDGELTSLKDKLIVLTGGLPFEMTLSRAEAEEKRTRKNPGPSLPSIKPKGQLIPSAPSSVAPSAPSPVR